MFADRSEGLNKPGGNIVLVLGKAEIELKVFFLTNTGIYAYDVDITDKLEEGESARSLI